MKRLFLLAAFLLSCVPKVSAQTQIQGFAADPVTCDSARGLLYYNTASQQFKSCGPAANTWSVFGVAGITNISTTLPLTGGPITTTGTLSCPNCAQKPATSDAVEYVSQNGNDANDGHSWGTAFLTLYTAYQNCPRGSNFGPGKGCTIYFSDNVAFGGPVAGQGLQIMGASDPNFASPPLGWLTFTSARFICSGPGSWGAAADTPQCLVTGADTNHVALWISAPNGPLYFEGMKITTGSKALSCGIDSNGSRSSGSGGCASLRFDNMVFGYSSIFGNGPAVDFGSNSFEDYFDHDVFAGNTAEYWTISSISRAANVITVQTSSPHDLVTGQNVFINGVTDPTFNGEYSLSGTADNTHFTYSNVGPALSSSGGHAASEKHAGFSINPGTGSSSSVFIKNSHFGSGGFMYVTGTTSWGSFLKDNYSESQPADDALVWVGRANSSGGISIDNQQVADPAGNYFVSRIDPLEFTDNALNFLSCSSVVYGPANIFGNQPSCLNSQPIAMERMHQTGFEAGHVIGQHDSARREFGPSIARFTNFQPQVSSSWTVAGGAVLTPGQTAPDGTTNAVLVSAPGGGASVYFSNGVSVPGNNIANGDFLVAGVWIKSNNGGYSGIFPLSLQVKASAYTVDIAGTSPGVPGAQLNGGVSFGQYIKGDGEWQFASVALQVVSGGGNVPVYFQLFVDNNHPTVAYAPTVLYIPASAASANEVAEIAQHLQTYATNCPVASVCMLPGEQLGIGGSTQFLGLFTHANTANRTYTLPDTTGTIALTGNPSTLTNCSSSASPAVCASAAAGSVALPTNGVSSSIQVNTTAVTANSQIFVFADDTLGAKLGITCNSTLATLVGGLAITARTAGTSFTIANNIPIATNPLCVSYLIVN